MFVPFLSDSSSRRSLFRRKGGGKGASSSGGKAGKSSTSSSSSSSSSKSSSVKSSSKSKTIKSSSSKHRSSTTYGNPVVPVAVVIPAGQVFAGRIAGGASRSQIYGTRAYGSGYPGVSGRGTSGRGFPFIFWPIAWPLTVGGGAASALYLHNNFEYGDPTNSTRPGGALALATFPSASSDPPTTFRILSDNSTILSLIEDLNTNCTSLISKSSSLSTVATGSTPYLTPYTLPAPEQILQYYRASTIALSLDSYNNSATYATEGSTQDSPLPTMNAGDLALLECLNSTIGLAAPLINGAAGSSMGMASHAGMVGVVWVVLWVLALF